MSNSCGLKETRTPTGITRPGFKSRPLHPGCVILSRHLIPLALILHLGNVYHGSCSACLLGFFREFRWKVGLEGLADVKRRRRGPPNIVLLGGLRGPQLVLFLSPARAHCRQLTAQLAECVLCGQNGNTFCLTVFKSPRLAPSVLRRPGIWLWDLLFPEPQLAQAHPCVPGLGPLASTVGSTEINLEGFLSVLQTPVTPRR